MAVRRQFSMTLLYVLYQILFWTNFSRILVENIALEDRDSVSFWSRGLICFLMKIMKVMSPPRTQGRQI